MGKSVWEIFNKENYTEEGVRTTEEIYGFIDSIINEIGMAKAQKLSKFWNENASETFWILTELTNKN